MAGLLNQAAPFLATALSTLVATKLFFGTGKFQRAVVGELEQNNADIRQLLGTQKELKELRAQVAALGEELKKAQKAQAASIDAATKGFQARFDTSALELTEAKTAIDRTKKDLVVAEVAISQTKANVDGIMTVVDALNRSVGAAKQAQNAPAAAIVSDA